MLQKTLLTVLLITITKTINQKFSFKRDETKHAVLTYSKHTRNGFTEKVYTTKKALTQNFKNAYLIQKDLPEGNYSFIKDGDLKKNDVITINLDAGNGYYEMSDFEERDGIMTLNVNKVPGRIIV